jgi:hypothetical protein
VRHYLLTPLQTFASRGDTDFVSDVFCWQLLKPNSAANVRLRKPTIALVEIGKARDPSSSRYPGASVVVFGQFSLENYPQYFPASSLS